MKQAIFGLMHNKTLDSRLRENVHASPVRHSGQGHKLRPGSRKYEQEVERQEPASFILFTLALFHPGKGIFGE
jgi:hypothetical protein